MIIVLCFKAQLKEKYTDETMPVLTVRELKRLVEEIFIAVGAPPDEASIVAESLVEADLAGVTSHGVMRVPYYVKDIREGRLRPGSDIEVVRETETTALINGNWGFGQVVARKAVELVVSKAKAKALGAVAAFNLWHIGRLGEYTELIAREGLIGMGFCTSIPAVAPYGGKGRRLSTAPISIAAPSEGEPFLLDYATSVVAEGKLRLRYIAGEAIPEGWIVDRDGRPSTDPRDFYERGGALLPFGGHKGYALAMAVEILSGILSGAGFSCSEGYKGGNNLLFIALNPAAFTDPLEFKKKVSLFMKAVKETGPAEGFKEVLVPGEPEHRAKEERLRKGIEIDDEVWARIVDTARELGIDVERVLRTG